MMVRTDDEMYRVDRTYLGPKGRRFPFRATYRAYGIWLTVVLLLGAALLRLGVGASFGSVTLTLAGAVYLTIRIGKHLDADRPLRAVVTQLWHEVTAPREPRHASTAYEVTARAPRWRAGATPHVPWWRRLSAAITISGRSRRAGVEAPADQASLSVHDDHPDAADSESVDRPQEVVAA